MGLALDGIRLPGRESPLAAWFADYVFGFAAALLHPRPRRAQRVGLARRAAVSRQEAIGGARADPVLGSGAGQLLHQAGVTQRPTAVALLNAVFAPCEGAIGTGAALPHEEQGAVQRHEGACWALVARQLGAGVGIKVPVLARRQDRLLGCAACGQNPHRDLHQEHTHELGGGGEGSGERRGREERGEGRGERRGRRRGHGRRGEKEKGGR